MNLIFVLLIAVTGKAPHLSIDGEGYFRLMRSGEPVYAREADLEVTGGQLGSHGAVFLPAIQFAGSVNTISIDLEGHVSSAGTALGQLVLALPRGEAVAADGGFVSFADRPSLGNPGEGTVGVIRADRTGSLTTSKNLIKPGNTKLNQQGSAPGASITEKPAAAKQPKPSNHGDKLEVIVHVHSEVGADSFTLGQVAEISGPEDLVEKAKAMVIASSPIVGIKRLLDEHTLTVRLEGIGILPRKLILVCPVGADVEQKSQIIDGDEISQVAIDAVKKRFGGLVPFNPLQKPQPFVAPQGEVAMTASEPDQVGDSYFVTVTLQVTGKTVSTRTLTLVPSKDAPRARINDPVTVVLISGSTSVEVQGKVKAGGYLGQRIEVEITGVGSKTTAHIGTLVSMDRVEVQL